MTAKQRVLKRYPRAYSACYGDGASWFVYQQPAKAVPRGHMARVVTMGTGATAAQAWADALRRIRDQDRARRRAPLMLGLTQGSDGGCAY